MNPALGYYYPVAIGLSLVALALSVRNAVRARTAPGPEFVRAAKRRVVLASWVLALSFAQMFWEIWRGNVEGVLWASVVVLLLGFTLSASIASALAAGHEAGRASK